MKDQYEEYTLTSKDIERFDIFYNKVYDLNELYDILKLFNNISFIWDEEVERSVDLPTRKDLENFYYKYRI
jgi:hypothetical protein